MDQNGRLTPAEIAHVNARISQHNPICPICKSQAWEMADQLAAAPAMNGGGSFFAHVRLTSPCGYTMFFDIMKLGFTQTTEAGAAAGTAPVDASREADTPRNAAE